MEDTERDSPMIDDDEKARGTSAGLPLLLSSRLSHLLPETLHSGVFTENVFCINSDKLVMTFHSGNIFHAKK